VWASAKGPEGKLGDLGVAYLPGRPCPTDDEPIPGDCFHAPPEQLYGDPGHLGVDQRRQAADMFMLGDLIAYLLTGVTYNAVVTKILDPTQRWREWSGTFDEILPTLIDVHGRSLRRFREALYSDITDLVCRTLDELCYPDPSLRGEPSKRGKGGAQFDLNRYVTALDLIRYRSELALRGRLI
jgi:hypothetical protein